MVVDSITLEGTDTNVSDATILICVMLATSGNDILQEVGKVQSKNLKTLRYTTHGEPSHANDADSKRFR